MRRLHIRFGVVETLGTHLDFVHAWVGGFAAPALAPDASVSIAEWECLGQKYTSDATFTFEGPSENVDQAMRDISFVLKGRVTPKAEAAALGAAYTILGSHASMRHFAVEVRY